MSEEHNIIEKLLPLYCEGKITTKEKEIVEDWIHQSEEHYNIARQIYMIYLASDSLSIMGQVDTEKALEKVGGRIRRSRLKTAFIWGQRVAAILFFPLLIAYLVQLFTPDNPDIRMLEVRTNPGMTTSLTLPDGTKVSLNSESSLIYPEVFKGDSRSVRLSGEAFFEVVKDKTKRFVVSTPHNVQVEVLGTSFNMEAFKWDSIVSTTLISGKVSFITQTGKTNMKPGEKLVYNVQTNQANIYQTSGEAEISWKDGMIIFRKTPFKEALRMLTKRYNVNFVVTTDRYKNDSFTGSFSNHRLEQILDIFKVSSEIRWRPISEEGKSDRNSKIEIY